MRILVLVLIGCGSGSAPPAKPAQSPPPPPARTQPPAVAPDPSCDTGHSALTVKLQQGKTLQTPTGIDVTYVGSIHEDYEDGRFEDLLKLEFQRGDQKESRIVSVYAQPRAAPVLSVCWALTGNDEITLYPVQQ